jgi:UDP-glucose:(heptosyl)LPS alpha-1,3-glucosyltransferase
LPESLRVRTRLIAIGQDDPAFFQRQARALGLAGRVSLLPGRSDIPRFMLGADLLIHPAYNENTGTVLLEALVAGLPVLASAVCGYAHYVAEADGGLIVPEPFAQATLDQLLSAMLADGKARERCRANALAFAERADIYGNAEYAADLILKERR